MTPPAKNTFDGCDLCDDHSGAIYNSHAQQFQMCDCLRTYHNNQQSEINRLTGRMLRMSNSLLDQKQEIERLTAEVERLTKPTTKEPK